MSNFAFPVHLYMSSPIKCIEPGAKLQEAFDRLQDLGISCLAVRASGQSIQGVITRSDLLREGRIQAGSRPKAALLTLSDKPVSDLMSANLICVDHDEELRAAAILMVEKRAHRIFIKKNDVVQGVLSTRDVLKAIRDKRVNKPVSEYMSSPVFTVRSQEPLSLATDRLKNAGISGLVVMEEEHSVGLFTQRDALESKHLPATTPVEEAMSHALLCVTADTPLYRAAAQSEALHARRVVVTHKSKATGILTGLDWARVASS